MLIAAPRRNVLQEGKVRDGGAPLVRAGLANAREGACAPRSESGIKPPLIKRSAGRLASAIYFVQAFQRLRIGLV